VSLKLFRITLVSVVFSKKVLATLSSLVLAVVLFMVLMWAMNKGKRQAEAELIIQNTQAIQESLEFFFRDQNRYPSALEFSNLNIMNSYLNPYPPLKLVSKSCNETFVYKRPAPVVYQLNFCLPIATKGFKQGWNVIGNNN
jgi:hypothetical protein